MFQQFFKLFLLFRREFRADLLVHFLHHRVHFGGDIRPDFVVAFLSVSDDFLDCHALFRCQLERVIELLDKLFSHSFSETRHGNFRRTLLRMIMIFRFGEDARWCLSGDDAHFLHADDQCN